MFFMDLGVELGKEGNMIRQRWWCRCSEKRDIERSPVSELSDDLLIEIISRVPFKSTCCCKCVSTRWRDLVSHPDHRKKLPRSTLAGFFYPYYGPANLFHLSMRRPDYQSLSGNWCAQIDTSLSFISRYGTLEHLFDCCNGLLLCRRRMGTKPLTIGYGVCNPATETWVDVPVTSWSRDLWLVRLAFDPDISSHFHVFEFAPAHVVDANPHGDHTHIKGVRIYSSKTGDWTHPLVWESPVSLKGVKGVFHMGLLYSITFDDFVVAVSLEGNCMAIRAPHSTRGNANLYLSQGQLHLVNNGASELSVWALEDSNTENWTLKHNVSHLQLLGTQYSMFAKYYRVVSIHPESDVIFLLCATSYGSALKLMSYEMGSRKLSPICDVEWCCTTPCFSYVPLFSESLACGH
ncbi:unnamed protein product [Alopecurus aequalis]